MDKEIIKEYYRYLEDNPDTKYRDFIKYKKTDDNLVYINKKLNVQKISKEITIYTRKLLINNCEIENPELFFYYIINLNLNELDIVSSLDFTKYNLDIRPLFEHNTMEDLTLIDCNIKEIPNIDHTNIKYLNLSKNSIKYLPDNKALNKINVFEFIDNDKKITFGKIKGKAKIENPEILDDTELFIMTRKFGDLFKDKLFNMTASKSYSPVLRDNTLSMFVLTK